MEIHLDKKIMRYNYSLVFKRRINRLCTCLKRTLPSQGECIDCRIKDYLISNCPINILGGWGGFNHNKNIIFKWTVEEINGDN